MLRRKRSGETRLNVRVIRVVGRKFYVLRWIDPLTGQARQQSSGVEAVRGKRRLAERAAQELLDRLEAGAESQRDISWIDFELRYRAEYTSGLAARSRSAWATAKGHLERVIRPARLSDVTASALSRLAGDLRRGTKTATGKDIKPVRETTIASYLRQIMAALAWAKSVGLIDEVPRIEKPKRARGVTQKMRSRPITGEEYERLVAAVKKVRPKDHVLWSNLIEGLWLSGLRISEAVSLSWEWGQPFAVTMETKFPVFTIQAEGQKGHTDQLLPMAPEFAAFLRKVPPESRRGKVFPLNYPSRATRIIADIGKAAKIVVTPEGKCATAHDLRRSFGTRWARRLAPAELKQLMRHRSIETTMSYYVQIEAADLGKKLWDTQKGDTSGDTRPKPRSQEKKEEAVSQVVKER